MMTRPEIAGNAAKLCTAMASASEEHRKYGYGLIGYLLKTKHLGITYGGKLKIPKGLTAYPDGFIESCGLHTYTDSSWGSAVYPFGGYVVMYNNAAVSYSAKALKIVPDSTCEAETAVASRGAKETCAVQMVLEDVGRTVICPTPVLIDSKATRDVIIKPGSSKRTRYFDRVTMLVKRLWMIEKISVHLIGTLSMVADIFTKAVPKETVYEMRSYLLNSGSAEAVVLDGRAAKLWGKLMQLL